MMKIPKILLSAVLITFLVRTGFGQNENISEGAVFDGEPFMVVDPFDQQHIVIVWMGYDGLELIKIKERVSFDGGNTWSSIIEIPHTVAGFTSADPSMDFDSEGNLYVCFIDYSFTGTAGAVYIEKSTDGGLTWNAPIQVIDAADDGTETPVDRPWMVIDKSGTGSDGNIYVTTKPAPWIPIPNRNYFIASTNHGASFGDWRYIDSTGWQIGDFIQAPMATPAMAANGIFYCIYPSYEFTESIFPRFIIASTDNAGEGFNYDLVLTGIPNNTDTLGKYAYLLTIDPSNANHFTFIYFFATEGDADVFALESFNAGNTWSTPVRVNDDAPGNGVLQDLGWADYDSDGDLLVTWRDRRNSPDTGYVTSYEIWGAVKWKDSTAFSPNFRISDAVAPFNDVLYNNGNDFMCSAIINDTVYAAWGDTRDGTLNIWFSKMNAHGLSGTGVFQIAGEPIPQLIIYPNPSDDIIHFNLDHADKIEIIDASGKIISTQLNISDKRINISHLTEGNYFLRVYEHEKMYSASFTKT